MKNVGKHEGLDVCPDSLAGFSLDFSQDFILRGMLSPTNINHSSLIVRYLSHPWISDMSISEPGPKWILHKEVILLVDRAVSIPMWVRILER